MHILLNKLDGAKIKPFSDQTVYHVSIHGCLYRFLQNIRLILIDKLNSKTYVEKLY